MKKLFKKKKSKLATAAKILIPLSGVVAGKILWDNKGRLITNNVRSKILDKTEAVQEKIQKFHDFVQNSADESADAVGADETSEENTEIGEED